MALYNKYRPSKFADLCGQEFVKKILSHQVKENKLSNAYLFTGPAGIGKTTVARIFASMINCPSGMTLEPDINDSDIQTIMAGKNDTDVIEFDAASHRGIDEIKNIREKAYFSPITLRKKIWIIDECHQLTGAAWEAMLKLLEEPPAHAVFILCTTEPNKISETILTRCMALKLTPITTQDVYLSLKKIISLEQVEIEEEAVRLLAKSARGSMRQALSNLEKVMNLGLKVDAQMVMQCVGVMSTKLAKDYLLSVYQKKYTDGEVASTQAISSGVSPSDFLEEIANYVRHIMTSRYKTLSNEGFTDEDIKEIEESLVIIRQEIGKLTGEEAVNKVLLPVLLGTVTILNQVREMRIYNNQYKMDVGWHYLWRAFMQRVFAK